MLKIVLVALGVAVCGCALAGSSAEKEAVLVGKDSVATVVLSEKAAESSKLAAEELTNHVFLVTGKSLPIQPLKTSNLKTSKPPFVFIGTLDAYPAIRAGRSS